MDTLQRARTLVDLLPDWVKRVEYCTFPITTIEPNDTHVEKAVVEFNGCSFEILCYDRDYGNLLVFMNGSYPVQIKAKGLGDFFREHS